MNDSDPVACFSAEFDCFSDGISRLEIIQSDKLDFELWVISKFRREVVMSTSRDQWGVFMDICGVAIAQEDKTRSFIDAMCQALQYLRKQCEAGTYPATVTQDQNQSTKEDEYD